MIRSQQTLGLDSKNFSERGNRQLNRLQERKRLREEKREGPRRLRERLKRLFEEPKRHREGLKRLRGQALKVRNRGSNKVVKYLDWLIILESLLPLIPDSLLAGETFKTLISSSKKGLMNPTWFRQESTLQSLKKGGMSHSVQLLQNKNSKNKLE